MSEHEKNSPYTAPPPYNQEFPSVGFQGTPQMAYHDTQPSGNPGSQPSGYPGSQPSGYPPLQPTGYPGQVTQSPMVVPTATIIQTSGFGESPRQTVCPNCHSTIMTRTSNEISNCQHLICCFMCLTVGCSLCSCLPYCCSGCANVRHECPRCGTHLGSYTR